MPFKITARTILQLGAELISSDAIAFYELIKNAFDAKSKKVTVRVVMRIPYAINQQYQDKYSNFEVDDEFEEIEFESAKKQISNAIDFEAPDAEDFRELLADVESPFELRFLLKEANYISIEDQGEGMSLKDLEDIYLTIGTRNRKKQREEDSESKRPILGEKGLGRLSVMRLGDGLRVETTQAGEKKYSLLEIDWTMFSHDSDALLDSVSLSPKEGRTKTDRSFQGTTIYIYDLRGDWSKAKFEDINKYQLSKFIDPFGKKNRDFIKLWFNSDPVILEELDKILFQYAHATAKANLEFDKGNPVFHGEIFYKSYNREKTFSLAGIHLSSVLNDPMYKDSLQKLGPFSVELYWYNRKLLRESEGVLDAPYIKRLVDTWGGGLMVYRDGFRVNPYGGPGDDWLSLDPRALASPGYKMNRKQFVGKVDISTSNNPKLLDQTNREGLRDNPEKKALVELLQYFIWEEIKIFLDDIKRIEEENIAALSLKEIESRIESGQKQVRSAIESLKKKYPAIKEEKEILSTIEEVLEESSDLFKKAKASADVLNDRLKTTIDLAGLGLMVDVIAHELNRSTDHALKTIESLATSNLPSGIKEQMDTLRLQLKTLRTRLKVIDPLGPSGRQQKATIDLLKLIVDTLEAHKGQFKRHNIQFELIDKSPSLEWKVRVVPGMIVQILENLISNSVYWIKQEQNVNRIKKAHIEISLDRKHERFQYSDNGPGIPRPKKDDIFRPFYSTKPPGEGKGLGLYISSEIAKYHGANLKLIDDGKSETLNTFVFEFKNQ